MLRCAKVFALVGLLCQLTSAADSCAEGGDETSLAQLHQVIHKRGKILAAENPKTSKIAKEAEKAVDQGKKAAEKDVDKGEEDEKVAEKDVKEVEDALKDASDEKTGNEPMFTDDNAPPISTTNKCIMMLATQYFALYTALAIARTLASFQYDVQGVKMILETGCTTVTYAPMLCVLFLGARMRAIQLSQGQTSKYELPQPWVQDAMFAAAFAVMMQVVLVLIVGFMSGLSNVKTDSEGNLDLSDMEENGNQTVTKVLTLVRYVVMLVLYGSMLAVVYGIFTMEGPKAIWGTKAPPVSPAVFCTMLLSGLFFLAYGFVAITQTLFEIAPKLRDTPGLLMVQSCAKAAQMTVNFAPMLCLLFVGARMRALQIDPKHGNPQSWAQTCFYLCTGSVMVQAALVIILPVAVGATCKRGQVEGDVSFEMENKTLGAVIEGIRYLCLFALYGGVATVVYSVFVISAKPPHHTPPVSPMMKCTMTLAALYFFVYTGLFVCITAKSFVLEKMDKHLDPEKVVEDAEAKPSDEKDVSNDVKKAEAGAKSACCAPPIGKLLHAGKKAEEEVFKPTYKSPVTKVVDKAIAILDAGRATVMFAPMLSCLFMGARMRSLQLAKNTAGTIPSTAGPQPWVQTAMFMSTGAVLVQLVMTMLVPMLTGQEKPELDEDGNVKMPEGHDSHIMGKVVTAISYIMLICMYGGACTVAYGVYAMTPETIQPYCNDNH